MKSILGSLTLVAVIALTSFSICALARGGGSSVGPANPAAQNCIALGGVLETYTTPAGENANCAIEEWKLFQEMSDRGLVKHGPGVGMPNPASVNCIDIGGSLRTETTPAGDLGICVVEQWTLYRVINVVTAP